MWALTNDVLQRVVTFNKGQQRRYLSRVLQQLNLPAGSRVLDFGCGTALFAPVFRAHGFEYYGYDIDPRWLRYAGRLYRDCAFIASADALATVAPFQLILANCCFHHISTAGLPAEIARLRALLTDDGRFLMIDPVIGRGRLPVLKRLGLKVDRGGIFRTPDAYRKLLEPPFVIDGEDLVVQGFGPFSRNPFFLDLAVFRCRK